MDDPKKCPKCHFSYRKNGECFCTDTGKPMFIPDFHDGYYDHGLGQYIKSKQHRAEVMKEKNLVEVGNERIAVDAEKREKRFDESWKRKMTDIRYDAMRGLGRWN